MVEKILFSGQIFEIEILIDWQVLRSPESENHILAVGLCECVIGITQKQIIEKTLNLAFYIFLCIDAA